MNRPDQAAIGGEWRMHLRDMRTLSGLRSAAPSDDVIRRMPDRVLRAAVQNPDHSEAARAAAEAELRARSIQADRWRLRVPGFIRAEDLQRGEKLFFGWGRAVRMWSGAAIYLVLLALLAGAVMLGVDASAPPGPETPIELTPAQQTAWAQWSPSDNGLGVLGLIMLAPFLVWFAATALRRKPARVLLLRKFNVRDLAEPLERMLAHELRPYGHIASLSDKFIRREHFGWVQGALLSLGNPIAAAWFVIGMPIRFVWRLFDRSAMGPAVVLNARDYRNLARRLRDRVGLNVQAAMVSKEAFLIRTSDAWWRMVVRLLMESSDAIVVDLSQIAEGTAWELDVIAEEGAAARCVFVAIWGRMEAAEAALRERGIEAIVHHYAPDGEMQRRAAFRAAMLAAMRTTHQVRA